MSVKYFGSDALNKLIDLVKTALGLKADNVSGATADDIATLTSVGNLKDSGISSLKVADTGFVTSAVIKNNINENAVDVTVSIEPNQDLHGYGYPWVGGTGKNLLNLTATSETINGVTITVYSDGTLVANGTATANVFYNVKNLNLSAGEYILNGSPTSGGLNNNFVLYVFVGSGDNQYDLGNGVQFTGGSNTIVRLAIYRGYTANNLTFKPMIRLASVVDPTFEPYSNICPISGRSKTSITFIGDQSGTMGTYQMGDVYYGGVFDVTTGELIIDRAYAEFDGSDDEGWNSTQGKNAETALLASVIKKPANNNTVANIICNRLKATTANKSYLGTEIGIAVGASDGYIGICIDGAQHTTAEYKTWLSNNPLQVVYELAEPITYNITANTVRLPLGNSTGTASTGDIRVKYEKKFTDYYDDEIEELDSKAVKLVDGQPLFKYYEKTIGTIGPSASAPVGNWQRLIIAKPVIPGYTIFTAFISDYMGSGSTSLMMELVFSLSDSSSYLIFEANKTIQGVKVTYVAVRSDLISAVS